MEESFERMDGWGSGRDAAALEKEWFSVQGDLDDFIFYDPSGYDWPLCSDL